MPKVEYSTCRFRCTKGSETGHGQIYMETQYDEPLTKEAEAFSRFTPSGSINFHLDNPNLAGFYVTGKDYYMDIYPVESSGD